MPLPATDVIAVQLAAVLEAYDARIRRVVQAWPDPEGYAQAGAQVESIRLYSASLPQLRVAWIELLITHAELAHHLWAGQHGTSVAQAASVASALEQHLGAVALLRDRCRRLAHADAPAARQR